MNPGLAEYNALCDLVWLARELNRQGHNSATSGNFSLKGEAGRYWISESGVDKSLLTTANFLPVDQRGVVAGDELYRGRKTSDETAVHLALYAHTSAGCVLHAHSMAAIIWSETRLRLKRPLALQGWELLKGLRGVKDHAIEVPVGVLDNTQDMPALAAQIPGALAKSNQWGLILRGHGIYVWGQTVTEAKRHWETYQYLFELENQLNLQMGTVR